MDEEEMGGKEREARGGEGEEQREVKRKIDEKLEKG